MKCKVPPCKLTPLENGYCATHAWVANKAVPGNKRDRRRRAVPAGEAPKKHLFERRVDWDAETGVVMLTFSGALKLSKAEDEERVVKTMQDFREKLETYGMVQMEANINMSVSVDAEEFLAKADPTPADERGKSLFRDGYIVPQVIKGENPATVEDAPTDKFCVGCGQTGSHHSECDAFNPLTGG